MQEINELLKVAATKKASDLFIKANSPPAMRISGRIHMTDAPPLSPDDCRNLAYSVMTHEQIGRFEHRHELDLAFEVEGVCRIRCNVYMQRGTMGMVLRLIPLEDLLPGTAGNAAGAGGIDQSASGIDSRHRADRIGQVHDDGRHD